MVQDTVSLAIHGIFQSDGAVPDAYELENEVRFVSAAAVINAAENIMHIFHRAKHRRKH